jgi:surface polysaccharide O-acyltransferase-like enzyme
MKSVSELATEPRLRLARIGPVAPGWPSTGPCHTPVALVSRPETGMATRLLLLNGVAILGVILFHGTGYGFTAMFAWAHRYRDVISPNYGEVGSAAYYALRLVEQFVVFCIPAFLFVSGYFVSVLAGRSRSPLDARAIGARVRHLLAPYLFWSAVVVAALALEGRVFSLTRYLKMIAIGSTGPNYYYVPLLVQLYLVAPAVVALARWRWGPLLIATGLLQAGVYVLQYVVVLGVQIPGVTALAASLPKWLFVAQLFWFTFGVVAGFEQRAFKLWLARTKWVWLAATFTFFAVGVVEWELLLRWSGSPWRENRVTLIDALYAGALILSFLAFANVRPPLSRWLSLLGSQSFGIYLVHGLVMEYVARGLYHAAPWVLGRQLVLQPLILIVGLAVPLLLMRAFRRSSFSGLYTHVFG